ncbi:MULTISPECIES: menaquinone biosynthesis family protein [unclassified Helicobacter]|uniref:menaquinone biosynthesis family protein n=1 Tax=unclassified Helicobacter TaxID=2593540 RepID=UPI000CF0935D|nr:MULTISPECIES: MqnA/MqnD/SBP family protein [unclassified Helicobacter]
MISVGHSPDADDLFMYYPIVFGWANSKYGLKFKNIALDIQTLNQKVLKQEYDVSAISFALYPKVRKEYALLRTGVSFGNGYGPKLVKRKNTILKRNFKVALSGEHTSNALLFKIAYPDARIIYKNFLEIEKAVLDQEVDAGVLIHESILCYDQNLVVERELWDIWLELAKENLPLPLGGMVIRRSIPLNKAIDIENTLTDAVKLALTGKRILSNMLLERGIIRVGEKELQTYLNLYANTDSIEINEKQKKGIEMMFRLGYDNGFYDTLIDNCEDYCVPKEYLTLRYS